MSIKAKKLGFNCGGDYCRFGFDVLGKLLGILKPKSVASLRTRMLNVFTKCGLALENYVLLCRFLSRVFL